MTIRNLIDDIADDKKLPKKIRYDGYEMRYDNHKQDYIGYGYDNNNQERWLFMYMFSHCRNTTHFINDKVEIIEEDKTIEKISINNVRDSSDLVALSGMQWENNSIFRNKINELIDEINKLKENK